MAQTRGIYQILQLTGNLQLTVALTKAIRSQDERVSGEVREGTGGARQLWLRRYRLFVTAANEGRGIAELRSFTAAARSHAAQHRSRRLSTVRLR